MDKKNTMLLTVIAVATLLVAVVGATFAYYTISTVDTNNTSTFTAATAKVGTVTMTRETENMHIAVSAADMSTNNQGTTYYSITGAYTAPVSGPIVASRGTTAVEHNLFTATASNGESDALYDCHFTLTAVKSGTMASELSAGDATLVIGGASTVDSTSANGSYDLVTHFTAANSTTLTKTVYFHNISGTAAQTLTGHLELHNTSESQNDIADKTLTVTLSATGLTCEQVNAHATTTA